MTEEELEKKIAQVYKRASEETTKKLDNYTSQFEKKDKEMLAKYKAGEITRKEYDKWRVGQIAIGKRWDAMRNQLAKDMLNADNIAKGMINDYLPEAYAEGFNFASYQVADAIGTDNPLNASFTLYDRNAVENLIKNEPELLPQLNPESKTAKDIREGRILRWDNQKINSEVTQGLLQGESMSKVAKRMEKVVGMNERSAIRNARTAVNGASNAGKERGFERAEELGIEVEQVWLASLDDRTRIEHRKLDGQVRKLGEKFKVDGYEIGYPCDPTAEPEMVYNCRCTVVPYLPKYDNKIDLEDRNTDKMSQDSYEEWKKGQPVYDDSYKGPLAECGPEGILGSAR